MQYGDAGQTRKAAFRRPRKLSRQTPGSGAREVNPAINSANTNLHPRDLAETRPCLHFALPIMLDLGLGDVHVVISGANGGIGELIEGGIADMLRPYDSQALSR